MRKVSLFISALAISILFLTSFVFAAPSKVIPLQGKLTQTNGVLYSGTYSMTFKLYDVANYGTSLYTETISNVPVSAGLFSVTIGDSNPLNLPFDQDYYIEITIGSETLSPRQKLLTSPYTITAQNVAGGNVNAAKVLAYTGTNPNLKVDYDIAGGKIGSETTYAYNAICIGNSQGNCLGYGGTVITPSVANFGGKVGIGTAIPQEKLHVVDGSILTEGTGGTGRIVVKSTSVGGHQYELYPDQAGAGTLAIYDRTTDKYIAVIDVNDNVGIGTATPKNKLHVSGAIGATEWVGAGCEGNCEVSGGYAILYPNGNIVATGDATFGGSLRTGYQIYGSAGQIGFFTDGNSALPIKAGSLTISDTYTDNAPANGLFVKGNVNAAKVLAYTGTNPNLKADYDVAGGKIGSETTYAYNAMCIGNSQGDCLGSGGTVIKPNTATFGRNVGIGTSNPSQALDVVGNGVFRSSTDSNHAITLYNNQADKTWNIYQLASDDTTPNGFLLEYYTGGTSNRAFTVAESGKVGIGTPTPQEKLHVNGAIETEGIGGNGGRIILKSTAQGGHQYELYSDTPSIGDLGFFDRTTGAQPITIKNDGKVGIGITAPTEKLDVAGTVKANRVQVYSGTNPNLAAGYQIAGGSIGSETTYAYNAICVGNQNGDCTGTGGTVIKSNIATFGGNVGIGTTTPQKTLDVAGSLRTGNVYGSAGQIGFLNDDNSALPIKSGSLTISDTYTDNAPVNGLYVKGNIITSKGTITPPCPGRWSQLVDTSRNVIGYFWSCDYS